jgi:hypothetical protein
MPSPTLLPKQKREERRVFLPPKQWEELSEVAEFHSAVFEVLGADEKVSRNDIIESFLRWAVDAYWEDKGGKPGSEKERAEKIKRAADGLRKLGNK